MHAFCENCIVNWSARNASCPICRAAANYKGTWDLANVDESNGKMKEYMDVAVNKIQGMLSDRKMLREFQQKY